MFIPEDMATQIINQRSTPDNNSSPVNTDPLYLLDIGCNEGNLTLALADTFIRELSSTHPEIKTVHAVGADIDSELIRRATLKAQAVSFPAQFHSFSIMEPEQVTFLGSIPAATSRSRYDLVTVFSVTMWIHLNHGDKGLFRFLTSLSTLSNNLLIEPQNWRSYKKCVKRWKQLGELPPKEFKNLEVRNDVDVQIVNFLTEQFGYRQIEIGKTHWKRRMVKQRKHEQIHFVYTFLLFEECISCIPYIHLYILVYTSFQ